MGITFRDANHQPVIFPQGVSLIVRYGSVESSVPLFGGAYFLCARRDYELALDGGKRYQIKFFSGFRLQESACR